VRFLSQKGNHRKFQAVQEETGLPLTPVWPLLAKTCSYVEIIDHGSRVARRMVEMLRSYHWLAAVQTAIVALDEAALDDEERE